MNNIGIDDLTIETFRLAGVGWIFAFFIVGATILAGRWLLGWQLRRIERIMARQGEPGAEGEPGAGSSETGNSKTP
ncbi:MAG: hypothetical protein ACREDM_04655 [Methylocella sp.]